MRCKTIPEACLPPGGDPCWPSPAAGTAGQAAAAEALPVVASFSILGDLTQQIGGDRVQVHTPGRPRRRRARLPADPEPTPRHFRGPDW
jgi:hypothetical protein